MLLKLKDLKDLQNFYLEDYILTKEQLDEIPDNLLVRKIHINQTNDSKMFKLFMDDVRGPMFRKNRNFI
jgi:hypothetical protein